MTQTRKTQARKTQTRKTQRRKRNAPIVKLTMNARGLTRNQLYMGRVGYGLNGMFKGNTMKKGVSGGGNNNITNEDLIGLYPVNLNKLENNVKRYGRGNRNTSPYIRHPKLNDLPVKKGFVFPENEYEPEEPVYVPKLKLKLPPPAPRKATTTKRRTSWENNSPSTKKNKV